MRMSFNAVVAASLCLSFGFAPKPALAQVAPVKITIGVPSNALASFPVRVAEKVGTFAKHGIDAKVTVMDGGSSATLTALISGSIEVAAASLAEAILARTKQQPVTAFKNIYGGSSNVLVVSKSAAEKSGMSPNSPIADRLRAMEGMKIAFPGSTAVSAAIFRGMAASVGAKFSPVYMSQPAMLAAIGRDVIDGITVASPAYVTAVTSGHGVVWINGQAGELPPQYQSASTVALLAMQPYITANPQVIAKIHAAIGDAVALIKSRDPAVIKILADLYPKIDQGAVMNLVRLSEPRWNYPSFTIKDVDHELSFMKITGNEFPGADTIDRRAVIGLE